MWLEERTTSRRKVVSSMVKLPRASYKIVMKKHYKIEKKENLYWNYLQDSENGNFFEVV